jgi:hypothetical protein
MPGRAAGELSDPSESRVKILVNKALKCAGSIKKYRAGT